VRAWRNDAGGEHRAPGGYGARQLLGGDGEKEGTRLDSGGGAATTQAVCEVFGPQRFGYTTLAGYNSSLLSPSWNGGMEVVGLGCVVCVMPLRNEEGVSRCR